MTGNHPHGVVHLTLDELTASPGLARRLPAELARRYHAVPLAEAGGRITVAMADPDDEAARIAIARVLGPSLCVVQADPATIDRLVSQAWREDVWPALDVVVCPPNEVGARLEGYAEALAALLEARFLGSVGDPSLRSGQALAQIRRGEASLRTTSTGEDTQCREAVPAGEPDTGDASPLQGAGDLLLIGGPECPAVRGLLAGESAPMPLPRSAVRSLAVLAVDRPRWPLHKILLILSGGGEDPAVDWTIRLAAPAGSAVALLAAAPPVPGVPSTGAGPASSQRLSVLLSTGTALGCQVHGVARRLLDRQVPGALRLRQGPPARQVRREIEAGEYDLAVVAAPAGEGAPAGGFEGEWAGLLDALSGQPVLVANL